MTRSLFPLIAKRIDSLSTLPLTLQRVLLAAREEEAPSRDVAPLVEADPALTAKVLKVINSPFYGLRFKISTISHAIAMLGMPALRHLASGIAVFEEEDGAALDKCRFWVHSLAVAAAARSIAEQVRYDLPEEAYIAGLLHDLGKVVLDLYAPEDFREQLEGRDTHGERVLELERVHLGMDHTQVGALVAEQWNLPKILKDAIQFHHEEEDRLRSFPRKHRELVGIVAAANRICCSYGMSIRPSPGDDAGELRLYDGTGLGAEQVDRVLDAIGETFRATAGRLGFECADSSDFLDALREANAKVGEEPSARPEPLTLSERVTAVGEVIRRSRRNKSVEELTEVSLRAIQRSLALDRVLYLKVDLEEEQLQGKYFFDDTHISVDVGEIQLPLNPDGIVGAALRDNSAHRVDNWATDGELLRFLGVVEVVAAPIIVSEQPRGIICADYFFRNREISDMDVSLLGMLAMDLSLSIQSLVLSQEATKLRSLAAKDELTGLHNRRSLMKILQKEIDRAKRYGSPLSAVMVDIDHFKDFNDSYGHQAGDAILQEVTQLIAAASRELDVIGRYGGEEFLIVLPETHVDQATIYAERVRAGIETLGRERRKTHPLCDLTISIGVTSLIREKDDIESFIHRVDHAMYAAKDRGRNRVIVE